MRRALTPLFTLMSKRSRTKVVFVSKEDGREYDFNGLIEYAKQVRPDIVQKVEERFAKYKHLGQENECLEKEDIYVDEKEQGQAEKKLHTTKEQDFPKEEKRTEEQSAVKVHHSPRLEEKQKAAKQKKPK